MNKQAHSIALGCLLIIGCNTKINYPFGQYISTDSEQIALGKSLFEQNCTSCHNFTQKTIGPNLSGLTSQIEAEWIKSFIKNPQHLLESGDERTKILMEEYKVLMPAFPLLSESEIEALLSYMHSFGPVTELESVAGEALEDPIPEKTKDSGLYLELEFFTQIPTSDSISPLAKITKMESEPVSGRLFVQDQHGKMYELVNGKPKVFFDLRALRPDFVSKPGLATGFGSYAFHPEYVDNGLLYTSHTEKPGSKTADFTYADSIKVTMQWVLTEWKTANPSSKSFVGESREILRANVVTQIHGMQEIAFNPHAKKGDQDYGLLYVGIGDGGSAENGFDFISDHKGSAVWSSILRIDPQGNNSKNGQYGIPKDNPFVGQINKAPEVFAYGFRNPNRIFWDPMERMMASEIGHKHIEEINLIEPGKFYGWPRREGTFVINPKGDMDKVYALPSDDEKLGATYPFLQFDHDEGLAIIAGYFPNSGIFKGKFLFGDVPSGKVFVSDLNESAAPKMQKVGIKYEGMETTLKELCGKPRVDLKFGQDKSGQVYVLTKADGKIYRISN
jgi:glucose/arabinose dehydrogenase/mono/diheme cytochrome c family protein